MSLSDDNRYDNTVAIVLCSQPEVTLKYFNDLIVQYASEAVIDIGWGNAEARSAAETLLPVEFQKVGQVKDDSISGITRNPDAAVLLLDASFMNGDLYTMRDVDFYLNQLRQYVEMGYTRIVVVLREALAFDIDITRLPSVISVQGVTRVNGNVYRTAKVRIVAAGY